MLLSLLKLNFEAKMSTLFYTEHQNDKDEETNLNLVSERKGGRAVLHCQLQFSESEDENINWIRDKGQIPKKAFSQEVCNH